MLEELKSDKEHFVSENTSVVPNTSTPLLESDMEIKPFIKWSGGKRHLLTTLHTAYPQELGKTITRYVEPFVGGGAVLFDILKIYTLKEVYISDVNSELINTYTVIRDNCPVLISQLSDLKEEYLSRNEVGRKEFYYECRNRYNCLKKENSDRVELAVLFIFLNKTCFNGLYRVNRNGEFNVPIGSYPNPTIFLPYSLENISKILKGVKIICADYRQSLDFINENTFVYIDPPYRPLTNSSCFTSYCEKEFDDNAQRELAAFVKLIDSKGAKVLLSNSDPKNTDPDDNFFDELYDGFTIQRVPAPRMINSKGGGRGKINEILVSNY